MTKISEIALEIDKVAQQCGEDAYDLFRVARGAGRSEGVQLKAPTSADAIYYIQYLLDGCSSFDIARIERLVFGE
jgi:hypothetical protein